MSLYNTQPVEVKDIIEDIQRPPRPNLDKKMLTQNYNSAKELPHSRTPDEFRQLVSSNEFNDMKQQ